jgi:hypothetical protein
MKLLVQLIYTNKNIKKQVRKLELKERSKILIRLSIATKIELKLAPETKANIR